MGIRGLTRWLRERCPRGVTWSPDLATLYGERGPTPVAVDVSIFLYRWSYRGHPARGLYRQLTEYQRLGLAPVYVWDGRRPHYKHPPAPRHSTRPQVRAYPTQAAAQIRGLLQDLEVTSVQAPGEADLVLAGLSRSGQVAVIHSDDSDMIVRGCTETITHAGGGGYWHYHLPTLLQELGWSLETLVRTSVLMGCDYHHLRHTPTQAATILSSARYPPGFHRACHRLRETVPVAVEPRHLDHLTEERWRWAWERQGLPKE